MLIVSLREQFQGVILTCDVVHKLHGTAEWNGHWILARCRNAICQRNSYDLGRRDGCRQSRGCCCHILSPSILGLSLLYFPLARKLGSAIISWHPCRSLKSAIFAP